MVGKRTAQNKPARTLKTCISVRLSSTKVIFIKNNNNSMIIEVTLSPRVYCHLTSTWVAPEGGTTQ